mgnify:CR=1 FL=1
MGIGFDMETQNYDPNKMKNILDGHDGLRVLLNVALITVVVVSLWAFLEYLENQLGLELRDLTMTTLAIIFVVILIAFIAVFTKPLPGCDEDAEADSDREKRHNEAILFIRIKRYWMVLSYAFMIFSLVAAIVPFAFRIMPPHLDAQTGELNNLPIGRPIAIFLGCIEVDDGVRSALNCSPDNEKKSANLSWILHIGGNLTAFPPLNKYSEIREKLDELEEQRVDKANAKDSTDTSLKQVNDELERLRRDGAEGKDAAVQQLEKRKDELSKQIAVNESGLTRIEREIYYLQSFLEGNPSYRVKGGLAVPFYLVVLSMFGAAISLTRRIPEYQKQAAPGYIGTVEAPYLSPPKLREYLVFQIIQFVSAPFLATVAYLMVEPSTTALTVGLAFAAGFSSESVLVWLRSIVDKIRPKTTTEIQTAMVVGTISGMKNKSASDLEKELLISVVGHPELTAIFAEGGKFTIKGVPEGTWALEVVRQDAAGNILQTIYHKIAVEADRSIPVTISLSVP